MKQDEVVKSGNRHARIIALLWICFLLRGIFYCFLFPLWEGYDEYTHFAFVQDLSQGRSLPLATSPVSREVEESLKLVPLPWLLRDLGLPHRTHDDYWRLPEEERRSRQEQLRLMPQEWQRLPASASRRELLNWEAQQPPLYYWLLAQPLRAASNSSLPARVMLLRLLSIGIVSLAIPFGFVIAKRVFGDAEAALAATALVAMMPELMVDICRVGNESLALLLFTVLLYAVLKFVAGPRAGSAGAAALLALSLGLGLLTKAYFLTAVPAVFAILAWRLIRTHEARVKLVCRGSLALAAALAISGWWYWRNHVLTGSWSGVMSDTAMGRVSVWQLMEQIPRVNWRNAVDTLLFTHVWFGNWSFLQVRSWIYHAFDWTVLAALAGLLVLVAFPRLRRDAPPGPFPSHDALFVPLVFYSFFWLGLLYHVLSSYVGLGVPSSQGYYLYCLVFAEVTIMASGLLVLLPHLFRPWVLPVATLSFGLLDLYTVHFLFSPYYIGLIGHKATGALASFHIGQVLQQNPWELIARLTVNKPWIGIPGFLAIWAFYLFATFGLAVVSVRIARRSAIDRA